MNSLFVAWRPAATHEGWRPVGRLEHDRQLYRFWYTAGARKPGFHPFPGMESLEQVYESEKLFPLFANRLLSKSRPEYEAYLRWSGFEPGATPDPILVLGVTEGIRQTDAVEVFPCPTPDASGCYFNKFFLHGIRWMAPEAVDRINNLAVDEQLKFMPDSQNEYDPWAVAVRTVESRMLLGYVPRYLAKDFYQLANDCDLGFINLYVDRVNRDAPLQNRVLIRMQACWPDDFEPCSDEDFTPIPAGVPAKCS